MGEPQRRTVPNCGRGADSGAPSGAERQGESQVPASCDPPVEADLSGLRTLERLTFHVQDITDVLASAIWEEGAGTVIPDAVVGYLSESLEAVASVVDHWRDGESGELTRRMADAKDSITALSNAVAEAAAGQAPVNAPASVAMSLRRILTVVLSSE